MMHNSKSGLCGLAVTNKAYFVSHTSCVSDNLAVESIDAFEKVEDWTGAAVSWPKFRTER